MSSVAKKLELGDILEPLSHAHEQPTPALQWVIDHGFGLPETPTVMAYDASGLYIAPQSVSNPSEDRTVMTFASPVAGSAVLFIQNAIMLSSVRVSQRLSIGDVKLERTPTGLSLGGKRMLTEDDAPAIGQSVQFSKAVDAPTTLEGYGITDAVSKTAAISVRGDVAGTGSQQAGIDVSLSATGVAAGTYGSPTRIPVVTVDPKGRVTGVQEQTVNLREASELFARTSDSAAPTFTLFRGMLYAWQFSPNTMQSLYATFHMPHDYAPGRPSTCTSTGARRSRGKASGSGGGSSTPSSRVTARRHFPTRRPSTSSRAASDRTTTWSPRRRRSHPRPSSRTPSSWFGYSATRPTRTTPARMASSGSRRTSTTSRTATRR